MKKSILLFMTSILTIYAYQSTEKLEEIFNNVFQTNWFQGKESISGPGSSLAQTKYIRIAIPHLLKEYNIKTILDIPCGDFNWMRKIDLSLEHYIGADIVKRIIDKNNELYAHDNCIFKHLNAITDKLPMSDLILCRDLLVHFSYENIKKFFTNIKSSGSTYILMTHFPKTVNEELKGEIEWRPLDFQSPPFNFPNPIDIINEHHPVPHWSHKSLALWKIDNIPDFHY